MMMGMRDTRVKILLGLLRTLEKAVGISQRLCNSRRNLRNTVQGCAISVPTTISISAAAAILLSDNDCEMCVSWWWLL